MGTKALGWLRSTERSIRSMFQKAKLGAKAAHYCVLPEPKCLIGDCGANPCQHACTAALGECEESSDSPNTFFGGGGVSGGHLSAAQPLASMSSGGRLRGGPPQAAGPRSLRGGQRDSGDTVTNESMMANAKLGSEAPPGGLAAGEQVGRHARIGAVEVGRPRRPQKTYILPPARFTCQR